jgi:FMNH2-dependent dimethyl sulfone monooxygenase
MPKKMYTCTWAPTVFTGQQVTGDNKTPSVFPGHEALAELVLPRVKKIEGLGLSHLLIAQRWWGSGKEMEGSSLDCLAITAYLAAHTNQIHLVTAIHPGFFEATAIAKWGATMDWLSGGRWSINVTSGWNLREFEMYGIDALEHDQRYQRSSEFIDVLRGAWTQSPFNYHGEFYHCEELQVEPSPSTPIEIFQGGQSEASIQMAAAKSDWMFLNGGALERIETIVNKARRAMESTGRTLRFALYAAPICRDSDEEAWDVIRARLGSIDPTFAKMRRRATQGAQGMWSSAEELSLLDSNEGYASRLIGSPKTIIARIEAYQDLGIEMLHFDTSDEQFLHDVLPEIQ